MRFYDARNRPDTQRTIKTGTGLVEGGDEPVEEADRRGYKRLQSASRPTCGDSYGVDNQVNHIDLLKSATGVSSSVCRCCI